MSIADRVARGAQHVHNALYRRLDIPAIRTIKGMPILLLTVAGRKTGTLRTTPVVYITDAGSYVVAGSAGGQPAEPQWFRNLRAAHSARVQVGDDTFDVSVRIAEGEERERLWNQLVAAAPFFDGYRRKSRREIPLAVLTPKN